MTGYSEQEVVFNFEKDFTRRAVPFLADLGAHSMGEPVRGGDSLEFPHCWLARYHKNHHKRTQIFFNGIAYVGSHRVYGEPEIYEEPSSEAGERERLVAPPEGMQRKVTREVKAREEASSDYKGAVSFAITHTDKVSAKAKGGAEGIGEVEASAESTTQTSLKTDFGWANGQKSARETTLRGETTLNIPGNEVRILTIDVSRIKEVRPFDDIAYLDCELDIDLQDWAGDSSGRVAWRGRHDNIVHCANIQDLLWLMEGRRPVEYPGMTGFLDHCSEGTRNFYAWLCDRENRKVAIAGQRTRNFPSALNLEVRPE